MIRFHSRRGVLLVLGVLAITLAWRERTALALAVPATVSTPALSLRDNAKRKTVVVRPELVLQLGHRANVRAVAFSPDGKTLASGSDDRTVKLWDIQTGECGLTLKGHKDYITAVRFSSDGALLASAGAWNDSRVKLWNVATGGLLHTLAEIGSAGAISFAPDNKTITTGGVNMARRWDVATGALLNTIIRTNGPIAGTSRDGKIVVVRKPEAGTLELCDAASGTVLQTLGNGSVNSAVFSPDDKLLAGVDYVRGIRLWDVQTGALLRALEEPKTIEGVSKSTGAVAFSPDGRMLAGCGVDGKLRLWNVYDGTLQKTIEGNFSSSHARSFVPLSVAFSPDGKTLATGSRGDIIVWNVASGQEAKAFRGYTLPVSSVAFTPTGKTLVSGGEDKKAKLWSIQAAQLAWTPTVRWFESKYPFSSLALSPDGNIMAVVETEKIMLWNIPQRKQLQTLADRGGAINHISFAPDGRTLASASADKTLKLWDVASGTLQRTLTEHTGGLSAVAFSPDGKMLASAARDNTIRLWDAQTGQQRYKMEFETSQRILTLDGGVGVLAEGPQLAFSPDGKTLAIGEIDGFIKLWDVQTGEIKQTPALTQSRVLRQIIYSPDGNLIATASSQGAELWDVATARIAHTMEDSEFTTSLAFAPRTAHRPFPLLAGGSAEGEVRLWNAETGKIILTFLTLPDREAKPATKREKKNAPVTVEWIAYTRDGYYASSPGAETFIRWRVGDRVLPAAKYAKAYRRSSLVRKALQGEQ